jgi:hypothetical protein
MQGGQFDITPTVWTIPIKITKTNKEGEFQHMEASITI